MQAITAQSYSCVIEATRCLSDNTLSIPKGELCRPQLAVLHIEWEICHIPNILFPKQTNRPKKKKSSEI